jgi:glycosyltransferase involved in cell wall biosynthesis
MATGCLIVGSDTAPVREVIRDGENGVLVGFFDKDELVRAVVKGLGMGEEAGEYRRLVFSEARGYSMREGVVGYGNFIERSLAALNVEVAD